MPVRGKKSIADTYVSILPETSRVASEIAKAFRATDREAREAGRRWKQEIESELRGTKVHIGADADTAKAKGEIDEAARDRHTKIKVDVDRDSLGRARGALKVNASLVGVGLLAPASTALASAAGAVQQLVGAGLVLPGVMSGAASSVGVATFAMGGMKDAYEAVTKASDGTQASVDAANKALAGLAPNAAETVTTVVGLKGTFAELRNIAGQNMFDGVSGGIKSLLTADLPALTRGIDGISRGLNHNILQATSSLSSSSSQGILDRILGNTADAQERLTRAIDPAIHAVGVLSAAGSDTLPRLATAVGAVADRFDHFITAADGDGRLAKWIDSGIDGFTDLGNIALNVGKTFTGITEAAGGGAGLLGTIESATGALSTFVNSAQGQTNLALWFADGRDMLGQLKDVAVEAGPILVDMFDSAHSAAKLWLPLITDALHVLNQIPGGAESVVTAFVAWKTISGVSALVGSLTSVATLLKTTIPAAAATGAAATTAAWGPAVALLKQIPLFTFGGIPDQKNASELGLMLPGIPAGGGGPGAQRARRGVDDHLSVAAPVTAGVLGGSVITSRTGPAWSAPGSIFGSVPIPAISSYTPPVVTQSSGGGGALAAGLPGIDALLLSGVPSGKYDPSGDLAKGLGDCSSAVEDLVNIMDGMPTAGRNMSTGNAAEWLAAHGFFPGVGGPGDFRVGFNASHMQATLPGGTPFNWGSPAAAMARGIGGTGADDPAFTSHWYRPASLRDGDSPVAAVTPSVAGEDRSVREARQRVDDTQFDIDQSRRRLAELNTKERVSASEAAEAQRAVAKAVREHADAVEDLAAAQKKAETKGSKGAGGSDASQFGQDFMGGILQMFGFDGSLFGDPSQFGITKLLSGTVNWATQPAKGGESGGGSGGGGGSLLSSVMPQAIGALRLGSQKDGPVPFMGGAAGYDGGGSSLAAGAQFGADAIGRAARNGGGGDSYDYSTNHGDTINIQGGGTAQDNADTFRRDYTIPRARQAVR